MLPVALLGLLYFSTTRNDEKPVHTGIDVEAKTLCSASCIKLYQDLRITGVNLLRSEKHADCRHN